MVWPEANTLQVLPRLCFTQQFIQSPSGHSLVPKPPGITRSITLLSHTVSQKRCACGLKAFTSYVLFRARKRPSIRRKHVRERLTGTNKCPHQLVYETQEDPLYRFHSRDDSFILGKPHYTLTYWSEKNLHSCISTSAFSAGLRTRDRRLCAPAVMLRVSSEASSPISSVSCISKEAAVRQCYRGAHVWLKIWQQK